TERAAEQATARIARLVPFANQARSSHPGLRPRLSLVITGHEERACFSRVFPNQAQQLPTVWRTNDARFAWAVARQFEYDAPRTPGDAAIRAGTLRDQIRFLVL